ncbi:MAG: ribose 5-phosphate isomerase B [Deltaproteobacteria bacterium]|nr:ribose 5-phosphate isomerase B [Deltaproteobacteria bacterium]
MKIAIGADHGGLGLKTALLPLLSAAGHEVVDLGTHTSDSVDYPDYAQAVGRAVLGGEVGRGLLICGTGIGMSIAANKIPGLRAALVSEPHSARLAAVHNDAQVLCLGGRVVGVELALSCVSAWLSAEFEGDRHARRLAKLEPR